MEHVWAKHPETHFTPETSGSLCDMCESLWCRLDDRSRLHPYRYHCDAMHANLTTKEMYEMTTSKCPKGRVKGRRFK